MRILLLIRRIVIRVGDCFTINLRPDPQAPGALFSWEIDDIIKQSREALLDLLAGF